MWCSLPSGPACASFLLAIIGVGSVVRRLCDVVFIAIWTGLCIIPLGNYRGGECREATL